MKGFYRKLLHRYCLLLNIFCTEEFQRNLAPSATRNATLIPDEIIMGSEHGQKMFDSPIQFKEHYVKLMI